MERFLFGLGVCIATVAVLYVAVLKTMHVRDFQTTPRIHALGISLPYNDQTLRAIHRMYYPYFAYQRAKAEKSFPVESVTARLRYVTKEDKRIALGPIAGMGDTSLAIHYTDEQAPLFEGYRSLAGFEPPVTVKVSYRKRITYPDYGFPAICTEPVLISFEKVED